jgi:hypothetical protein
MREGLEPPPRRRKIPQLRSLGWEAVHLPPDRLPYSTSSLAKDHTHVLHWSTPRSCNDMHKILSEFRSFSCFLDPQLKFYSAAQELDRPDISRKLASDITLHGNMTPS